MNEQEILRVVHERLRSVAESIKTLDSSAELTDIREILQEALDQVDFEGNTIDESGTSPYEGLNFDESVYVQCTIKTMLESAYRETYPPPSANRYIHEGFLDGLDEYKQRVQDLINHVKSGKPYSLEYDKNDGQRYIDDEHYHLSNDYDNYNMPIDHDGTIYRDNEIHLNKKIRLNEFIGEDIIFYKELMEAIPNFPPYRIGNNGERIEEDYSRNIITISARLNHAQKEVEERKSEINHYKNTMEESLPNVDQTEMLIKNSIIEILEKDQNPCIGQAQDLENQSPTNRIVVTPPTLVC